MRAAEKLKSRSSPPKNQGPGNRQSQPLVEITGGKVSYAAHCFDADGHLLFTCLALAYWGHAMHAIGVMPFLLENTFWRALQNNKHKIISLF